MKLKLKNKEKDMKGLQKQKIDLSQQDDLYLFFNSPAEEFYRGNFIYKNINDFSNRFKSELLYFLVEFERVVKATFNSSINLENVDVLKFKQMFPNFSENIFKINSSDDLIQVSNIIKTFRNINAHAIPSKTDYKVFRKDYSSLENQKVYCPNIKYLNDGRLTVAGLVFIIVNLGRSVSIKSLTHRDTIFGLITCGNVGWDDGVTFVTDVSHVDWEIKIRDDKCSTLEQSILGCYLDETVKNNSNYVLKKEYNEVTDFSLDIDIYSDRIVMKKGSVTGIYYESDYELLIPDATHFIELSNQFPPIIFVDLLCKIGIKRFDNDTYLSLINPPKWNLYKKLMYAKFYSDKNIDILLSPRTKSDIRLASSTVNGSLTTIFIRLEKLIIKFYKIDLKNIDFSKLFTLLTIINAPDTLVKQVQIVRNLVSHGYILGEYVKRGNEDYQYTLENVADILSELVNFFAEQNAEVCHCLRMDISKIFIQKVLGIKTNNFFRESKKFINQYPDMSNLSDLKSKQSYFDNSYFNSSVLASINSMVGGRCMYVKIEDNKNDLVLVIREDHERNYLINQYLNKTGCSIVSDTFDGVSRNIIIQ